MIIVELGILVGCIENKRLGISCIRVLFFIFLVISLVKDNIYTLWILLIDMYELINENIGIILKFE